MSGEPNSLDRPSVVYAIKDYLVQVNYRGYNPDRRKVLSIRRTDRTAWLRNAVTPVRWEFYYFIEGELFPEEGSTRLDAGQTPQELAEKLVDEIWDDLQVWNGYDFTATSSGLNRGMYMGERSAAKEEPLVGEIGGGMNKNNDSRSGYITLRFAKTGLEVSTIADFMSELVRTDPRNALPEGDNIPIWEEPLVAVAAASESHVRDFEAGRRPHPCRPRLLATRRQVGHQLLSAFFQGG